MDTNSKHKRLRSSLPGSENNVRSLYRRMFLFSSCWAAFFLDHASDTKAADQKAADQQGDRMVSRCRSDFVTPQMFGAKADGLSDDTASIEKAFLASQVIYFPPGHYIYNGSGVEIAAGNVHISGSGIDITTIKLGNDCRLIDSSRPWQEVLISDMTILNGAGAFRSKYLGTNVSGIKIIQRCRFKNYTVCAVENNGADEPYWRSIDCIYDAASSTGTIGIALSRNADLSWIGRNTFLRNQVHLKLRGSGRVNIEGNDFIEFDASTNSRAKIWLTSSGDTSVVLVSTRGNKFGNENQQANDFNILVAGENTSGRFNGERLPDTNVAISGAFTIECDQDLVSGTHDIPFVMTYAKDLRTCRIVPGVINGTPPSFLVKYWDTTWITPPQNQTNLIEVHGTWDRYGVSRVPWRPATNMPSAWTIVDHAGTTEAYYGTKNHFVGGGSWAGYTELLSTRAPNFRHIGDVAIQPAAVMDSEGGEEAGEFFLANGVLTADVITENLRPNEVLWIEFELRRGASSSLLNVYAEVRQAEDLGLPNWQRTFVLGKNWVRYRFAITLAAAEKPLSVVFGNGDSNQSGWFCLGRCRIYHAREPVRLGTARFEQLNIADIPTSPKGLNPGQLWVDVAAGNTVKRVP